MHPIFMPRNFLPVIGRNGCDGKHNVDSKDFEFRANGTVRDLENNQVHSIKELLSKNIDFSWDGPLESFSNLELTILHEIQYGISTPLLLSDLRKLIHIPEDYTLYAAKYPTGIGGGRNDPLGSIHGFFFEDKGLNVLSCTNQETHLGTKIPIFVTLYFYKNINQAWQYVLYKSLNHYSIKNHQLALVLLVSSMDILTKELLIENYPKKIRMRLQSIKSLLDQTDTSELEYKRSLECYELKVQELRNNFEHKYALVDINDLQQAYKICFELFWVLGQMRPQKIHKRL